MVQKNSLLHTISARLTAATIHFLLTVGPCVACRAGTAVSSTALLCAHPTIEARAICTLHSAHLTVLPIEALRAAACVTVLHVLQERNV